ncbi:MAG: hypothetical protein ABSD73_12490 [Candidatus Bathyarchaeia archaeon]|jgi:hypothetical protein
MKKETYKRIEAGLLAGLLYTTIIVMTFSVDISRELQIGIAVVMLPVVIISGFLWERN